MSEKYPNLQRTNLAWDPYMKYLVFAIDEANYLKRAETKPMMTPRHADEPHLTSRATHLRETADIAKRIAAELGLNDDLAFVGMLLHDAGHPFSAHEGEVIFSELNGIFNIQFFHHNSKGLGIIWQEAILEDALGRIPDLTPELEKQLREEFYYFLDIVISHDGEASKTDLVRKAIKYDTLREAVEDKASKANTQNNYKFIAQTPEGQVAKYSDAIAYLATDIQDAFRMGFLEEFDEEYLEIIGNMILNMDALKNGDIKTTGSKEEKISAARKMIDSLQKIKLKEQYADIDENIDIPLIAISRTIQRKIEEIKKTRKTAANATIETLIRKERQRNSGKIDEQEKKKIRQQYLRDNPLITAEEIDNLINERILQYRKEKNPKTVDELLLCATEEEKIRDFTSRFLGMPSSIVKAVTEKIQDYFIKDILINSKPDEKGDNNMPALSQEALSLMDKLKKKNMREFVIDTKWEYQQKEYPEVALKMVQSIAANLVRAGVIRRQFLDPAIRKKVQLDAQKYMKPFHPARGETQEKQVENLCKKINSNRRFTKKIELNNREDNPSQKEIYKANEYGLTNKLIRHIMKKGQSFADQYMFTFNVIPTRVREKVNRAFHKEGKESEFYESIIQKQFSEIRREFVAEFNLNGLNDEEIDNAFNELSDGEQEVFIQKLVDKERENMEYKMAIQLTSDYFAGMTDESFKHSAISLGYLSQEAIDNAVRGGTASKSVVENLNNLEAADKNEGQEK